MMTLEYPVTVSVVIPSYNHKDFVVDAIRSVAEQKGDSFKIQLLVIDDGSTDGSVELLSAMAENNRYRFQFVAKENEGLCRTLNRAIREYAQGDLIAVLASDDMWRDDKLEQQVTLFRQKADCELCFSNARTFSERGPGPRSSKWLFDGDVRNWLALYNFVPAGTILFSRKLFDEVGGFDETGLRLEDWDFLLRAAAVTNFCYVDQDLLLYRLHAASSIARMRGANILFSEKMKVLQKNTHLINPALRLMSVALHFLLDCVWRRIAKKGRSE